jgi:hypothetical protein
MSKQQPSCPFSVTEKREIGGFGLDDMPDKCDKCKPATLTQLRATFRFCLLAGPLIIMSIQRSPTTLSLVRQT